MLRKEITYTNFNGKEVTKPFFFNITKAEIGLREMESDGTWSETLKTIQESNKGSVVLPEFRKIIQWVYGEKSEDGESFLKSDEIWAKFNNSEPWSKLIMELLQNPGYAAQFIKECMPADMQGALSEKLAEPGFRPGADTSRPTPPANPPAAAPQPEVVQQPAYLAPAPVEVAPQQPATEAPVVQQSTPREPDLSQ
jgi:hypothetical protein